MTRAAEPLWDFALRVYRQAGVADACLALQERFGLDVNMLLFAAWMGAERRTELSMPDIARADAEIGAWHAEIVRPLRRVRQRMKGGPAPAPSVATEALRTRLKAVEIEAERIELAVLERFGLAMPEPAPGAEDGAGTRRNLGRVVAHYSGHDLDDQTAERLRIIEAATRLAPKET